MPDPVPGIVPVITQLEMFCTTFNSDRTFSLITHIRQHTFYIPDPHHQQHISPLTAHDNQLMSDHTPVTCLIDADIIDKSTNKTSDFRRANWKIYVQYLNDN